MYKNKVENKIGSHFLHTTCILQITRISICMLSVKESGYINSNVIFKKGGILILMLFKKPRQWSLKVIYKKTDILIWMLFIKKIKSIFILDLELVQYNFSSISFQVTIPEEGRYYGRNVLY